MTPADETDVLAMNRLAEQVTSPLDAERFSALFAVSDLKQVAELDGEPVGFVLAITGGKPFENQNYRWFTSWFTERVGHFIYIDRVIVSPACQGQGVGPTFYAAVFDAARQSRIAHVCAEMDLEPPNHVSLQFHRKLGFTEIGTRNVESGKRLSMQVCEVGTQSETA